MPQLHGGLTQAGAFVLAIPGNRFVMACIRLLRCGSGLFGILIDLRLPTFRGGGAKRRVTLAEHMPADEKRSKGSAILFCRASSSRRRAQLSVGSLNPTPASGRKPMSWSVVNSAPTTKPRLARAGRSGGMRSSDAPWSWANRQASLRWSRRPIARQARPPPPPHD